MSNTIQEWKYCTIPIRLEEMKNILELSSVFFGFFDINSL